MASDFTSNIAEPTHAISCSRTPSINSARTESTEETLIGTLAIDTKPTKSESNRLKSSISYTGHSVRSSCPESLLLQRNHKLHAKGHKTPPFHYECKVARSSSSGRRKSSSTSVDDPLSVLNDSTRFAQANYECSFCSAQEPTFKGLLGHISAEHPWYDISIHRNIR
ncbi:hypothetical protein EV183_001574 [Coemansia sp. RSA 2336]|nr:hypothetical protein EV183_001574 [Coemansia sp. RSA 2336]